MLIFQNNSIIIKQILWNKPNAKLGYHEVIIVFNK